ncbi:hypothetical protein [Streptomyces sp. GS7]|uniref:hypothetical protein n=1 Tax=Streptomyces sp. GS7 TaxID=2692234 RepID=UPI0013170316|nr:hypothetical protein [Streptomyces sp. GS7]QHC23237.1 hypothetical protein GR130_19330 [Streptomyces sp. GS7]
MATWLKTTLGLAGLAALLVLLNAAAGVITAAVNQLFTAIPRVQIGTESTTGLWAVIDQPIRTYLATHTQHLAVSASTAYTLWQITGLVGLVGGFAGSTGARITWTTWGAATTAMVWTTAPADGRIVATGITTLAWTLASVLALRGLSLRPLVHNHIHNAAPQIRPEIHIPTQPEPDTLRKTSARCGTDLPGRPGRSSAPPGSEDRTGRPATTHPPDRR